MPIGSKLSSKNADIECKCEVPPMPHCRLNQLTFNFPEKPSKSNVESETESSADNVDEVVSDEPESTGDAAIESEPESTGDEAIESEPTPDEAETESESDD
jgi:hypothetical protein